MFEGRRREALFVGYTTSLTNFCSLAGTVIALGAGLAGLDTTLSAGTAQPDAAVTYVRAILAFFCPVVSALQGLCLLKFPITGERLAELNRKQATVFKKLPPIPTKAAAVVVPASPA